MRFAVPSRSTTAPLLSQPVPDGQPLTDGGRNRICPMRSRDACTKPGTSFTPATPSAPTTNSTGLRTSDRWLETRRKAGARNSDSKVARDVHVGHAHRVGKRGHLLAGGIGVREEAQQLRRDEARAGRAAP